MGAELCRVTYVIEPDPWPEKIPVSEQSDSQDFEHLERINAELIASLRSCRAILSDCQQKLAANSNEPDDFGSDEEAEL